MISPYKIIHRGTKYVENKTYDGQFFKDVIRTTLISYYLNQYIDLIEKGIPSTSEGISGRILYQTCGSMPSNHCCNILSILHLFVYALLSCWEFESVLDFLFSSSDSSVVRPYLRLEALPDRLVVMK